MIKTIKSLVGENTHYECLIPMRRFKIVSRTIWVVNRVSCLTFTVSQCRTLSFLSLQTPTSSWHCTATVRACPKQTRASNGGASIPCTTRSSISMCPLTRYPWQRCCSRLLITLRSTLAVEAWVQSSLVLIRSVPGKNSGNQWLSRQVDILKNGIN